MPRGVALLTERAAAPSRAARSGEAHRGQVSSAPERMSSSREEGDHFRKSAMPSARCGRSGARPTSCATSSAQRHAWAVVRRDLELLRRGCTPWVAKTGGTRMAQKCSLDTSTTRIETKPGAPRHRHRSSPGALVVLRAVRVRALWPLGLGPRGAALALGPLSFPACDHACPRHRLGRAPARGSDRCRPPDRAGRRVVRPVLQLHSPDTPSLTEALSTAASFLAPARPAERIPSSPRGMVAIGA